MSEISRRSLLGQPLSISARRRPRGPTVIFCFADQVPGLRVSATETMTMWPEYRGVHTGPHPYVCWISDAEALYDNFSDPDQGRNLLDGRNTPSVLPRLRSRSQDLLPEAHDDFLPGNRYAEWVTADRNLVRNGQEAWRT